MNFGRAVFPLALLGAFTMLTSFVAMQPARSIGVVSVEAGDYVVLELTGYYGKSGHVFLSTQEERWQAGQFKSREGGRTPQYQSKSIEYVVDPAGVQRGDGFDSALVGHRANRSFTTPPFPPALAFGDWQDVRSFSLVLPAYPLEMSFNRSTGLGRGSQFNLTQYLAFFAEQGYPTLRVGSVFPCEGEGRWTCRVLELDLADDRIRYRRNVRDGDQISMGSVLEGVSAFPSIQGDAMVGINEARGEFTLTWAPVVGDRFQLSRAAPGFLPQGTFEVLSVEGDNFNARFTSNARAPPHLIGETVWYDVVILNITRPVATATTLTSPPSNA